MQTEVYGCGFKAKKYVFGVGVGVDIKQCLCGCQSAGCDEGAVVGTALVHVGIGFIVNQQVYMLSCLALS